MSLLKFEDRTPRSLEHMCAYMCDSSKTDSKGIFGIGVNPYNAANEMRLVQNIYHRENLTHEYVQIIFCFDMGVSAPIELLREVSVKIGQILIRDERQVLGAIHFLGKDVDKPHCHYLINYVGVDGSLYQQSFHVNHYKRLVNEILAEYDCFQPIKFYENESNEVVAVQNKELACPWTIDERFIQEPIQDTAVSVSQFLANNSSVQMTSPVVTYSDENITKLLDCAIINYSPQSRTYSPVSPYVYSQSGQEMMCLLPASELYLKTSQGLPTPKLQAKPQDFTYDENSGTLYWLRNKNSRERCKLANFEVEVEKIYTLVATNAQEERITLSIRGKNLSVSFDMKLSKLTSLSQELSAQYPQFRIFCDLARANSIFQQYISEVYELSYETLPHETVYKNAGWQRSPNGYWHYYSGNDSDCLSDFRLAVVEHEPLTLIDWGSSLLEIADLQIMLPLFLHAHLGYTLKLFEDAGYNEQYILALIGSSGSKKTSLARVLFSLFGDALINFTSTNRGIELDLMSRQDSSLIMDDLSSGCDKVLAMKFEQILRQLGDSTGRKRSINGGNDLDCVATRCAVVLTAETDIDALSKSSKLRTLAVFLNYDSINSEKLSTFQDDELDAKRSGRFSKLEQYMTLYVKFLEAHYSLCVEILIDPELDTKRDFSFARQATIFNMLLGQAELILLFWEVCGFINADENIALHNYWADILGKVMAVNEQRGKEAEPYILFLQAIAQASHTGGISQSKDVFYDSCFGFFDCGKLFLYPDAAYNYVTTYYSRFGKIFTESPQALWNKLYALNLLEVYEQRNHKAKLFKKVRINNQSVSCLVLKWSAVKTFLENLTPEITISNGGNSNEH